MVDKWVDSGVRRPVFTAWLLVLCVVLGGALIAAILWGLGVFSAPVRGQGDAYAQKYSADNWPRAQTGFHREFETYQTYLVQIRSAAAEVKRFEGQTAPTDPIGETQWQERDSSLHTTLTGLAQQCGNTATSYNTDVAGFYTRGFRDPDLPDRLDPTGCTTAGG